MIKNTLFSILLLFCFYSVSGQISIHTKPKTFNTWAYTKEPRGVQRGILYEIGDSSIFLKSVIKDSLLHQYSFNNINLIKIRRTKNVLRGAIIGGTIGAIGGIIAVNTIPEGGLSFMTAPISSFAAFFFGAIGAGGGILAGSIKDWIPIRGKYANFNKYRGNLLNYSYLREDIAGAHIFDHRVYFETKFGFSFAGGEFASSVPDDNYTNMAMTGTSFNLDAGYRFNKTIGLNLVLINDNFSVHHNADSMSWGVGAFILSPVVSLPVSRQLRFDLAPGIGWAGATLTNDDEFLLNGNGLGLHFHGALIYNYSKRWFTSLNGGYLYSKQHYKEGGSGKIQTIDITLGIAFKFGRRDI
jgi:hypothetical protein